MTLCELLQCVTYDQKLVIYLTNEYDQNLLIGRGTRRELLRHPDEELFFHQNTTIQIQQ